MEEQIKEVLGASYQPVVQCGEMIGEAIADAIEKIFDAVGKKLKHQE